MIHLPLACGCGLDKLPEKWAKLGGGVRPGAGRGAVYHNAYKYSAAGRSLPHTRVAFVASLHKTGPSSIQSAYELHTQLEHYITAAGSL